MAQISPECVAGYAAAAGFTGNDIIVAVAVAKHESGFRSDAANSCCVGLWQINLKAHGYTADQMKNPMLNAQAAYKIWKAAGGWCTTGSVAKHTCNPWQAYGTNQPGDSWASALKTGQDAYAKILAAGIGTDILNGKTSSDAQKILQSKGLDCVGIDLLGGDKLNLSNPLDIAGTVAAAFNRMGAWITNPDNLMRIVKVLLGGMVILVGGAAIMDKEITSVTPVGKIAKVIR